MRRVFLEGRCRSCGMRVTVDREYGDHRRDGRWCGPVDTEHPFDVPDELPSLPPVPGPSPAAVDWPLNAS